jgi:hypothetical protein
MPTMTSSAASPCSGPSRSVIATARLNATTGLIRSGGWFRTCAASRIHCPFRAYLACPRWGLVTRFLPAPQAGLKQPD